MSDIFAPYDLGASIKKSRIEEGLTMQKLAELSKLSYNTIYRAEKNGSNLTIKTLEKILNSLGNYRIIIIKNETIRE